MREVTRQEFDGTSTEQGEEAWPRPGIYEIHVVDSTGNDVIDPPFRAEHVSMSGLMTRAGDAHNAIGTAAAALYHDMTAHTRNQRAELDRKDREVAKMRDELASVNNKNSLLIRENAALVIAKEAAERNEKIAAEREKQSRLELEELHEEVAGFRPHVQMGVDRFVEHLKGVLGLPQNVSNDGAAQQADTVFPPESEWDRPPMGVDDPDARTDALFSLILDPRKLRNIVEANYLSWDEARALFWLYTRKTLPTWRVFLANYDAFVDGWFEAHPEDNIPEDESQAAE